MKEHLKSMALIATAFLVGGFVLVLVVSHVLPHSLGASAQTIIFTGSSNNGEVSIATTDTNILEKNPARNYLKVCKTSPMSDNRQITFAINSSASHGRGFILDNRVPCMEFGDTNVITGLLEAVASPSAASVSFSWY